MDEDGERQVFVAQAQERLSKGEVPGAGHGKKFCEALNKAKEEIGEGLQVSSS